MIAVWFGRARSWLLMEAFSDWEGGWLGGLVVDIVVMGRVYLDLPETSRAVDGCVVDRAAGDESLSLSKHLLKERKCF